VTEALVTHFICRFRVPREPHSDQGCNFKFHLMQVLHRLGGVQDMHTLQPQSDGMVERNVKTAEEHLPQVVASHHRDCDAKLSIFLLAHKASTHDKTGLTPANLVIRSELHLSCDLLLSASLDKERPTIGHNYAQHLKLASDRMKTRYDGWLTTWVTKRATKSDCIAQVHQGKSPKFQPSWEDSYRVVTRINDVYRIQRHPRTKMVVHLHRLTPYNGTA
jgi:hypothetical protein